MKEECNLSIKVITPYPVARNSRATLDACAKRVKEWIQKGILFIQDCVFLDKAGFDINIHLHSRTSSRRGTQAILESISARGVSRTVIGTVSLFGVLNVSKREIGNVKKEVL